MSTRPSDRSDFEVAIICALDIEYDAVSYVFDEFYDEDGDPYSRANGDYNHYTTGRIGHHNVVLALLPHMGKASAASAAASLRSSYSGVRLALLVGVCGAVPFSRGSEIILGDVIISKTVVQYDFGRQYTHRFIRKDTVEDNLGRPNKDIRSLLMTLGTDRGHDRMELRTADFLQQMQATIAQSRRHQGKYTYPGTSRDKLYQPNYRHKHRWQSNCECQGCHLDADPVCQSALVSPCEDLGCEASHLITRQRLHASGAASPQPAVHLGAAASGDTVMKSAAVRDRLAKEEGVIMLEMEGAGVWDELPCIVVKGVCDYADSHKNKGWQLYAAATAASASKAILERYPRTENASRNREPSTVSQAFGSQMPPGNVYHQQQQHPSPNQIQMQANPYQQQHMRLPQNEQRAISNGPVFNGPISGTYVIPGSTTTGGVINFNFGAQQ